MHRLRAACLWMIALVLAACLPDATPSGSYPSPGTPGAYPPPQSTVAANLTPKPARLNQEFALKIGQTALIQNENLTVRFRAVVEDSRCPKKVTCVQAGQARITIVAIYKNTASPLLELNSNPALKQDRVDFSGYEIQLKALNPYPEEPNKKIGDGDYEATFIVAKK